MSELSDRAKINISVLGAGLGVVPITLGAVYWTEKLIPEQMKALKTWVAENIVESNPKIFDALSSGIRRANEKHDKKKREELVKRGESLLEEDGRWSDSKKKAYVISDSLVTVANALLWDFGATIALQKIFNHSLKVDSHPVGTAIVEGVSHLGCIALAPSPLFAGISENMHHGLADMIQRVTGLDREAAKDISLPFTYVTFPGLIATGAALIYANVKHNGR